MKSFYHSNESFTSQSRPKYGSFTSRLREISSHLTLLILILTVFSGNVWGGTNGNNIAFNDCHFYFNPYYDATHTINQGYIQLAVRKYQYSGGDDYDWWTGVTTLEHIEHTRLYYASTLEGTAWEDTDKRFHGWAMISNADKKGNAITEYWSGTNSTWYSEFKAYGLNSDNTYLFIASSASNGQTIDHSGDEYISTGFAGLNHRQTVRKYTCVNGTAFSAANKASGTVTISAYQMTGQGTASNTDNNETINTSSNTTAYVDAAYTGEVTVTASANDGYVFLGWYDSENNGTQLSSATSYTYNAPNSTYTIYARFAPKYTNSKTIYLKTTSTWENDNARFAAVFGNATQQTWVDCSTVVADEIYSVDVPSGDWGYLIFCRMKNGSDEERVNKWDNRWNQTGDLMAYGTYNCVNITGADAGEWRKYAPSLSIVGDMNDWDPVANPMSTNTVTISLNNNKAYYFKVAEGFDTSWWGKDDDNDGTVSFVGQTDASDALVANKRNMLILTAGTGSSTSGTESYTFTWDATNHKLTVTFPDITAPSNKYVYYKNHYGWTDVYGHANGTHSTVWTGAKLSYITFGGTNYYYAALGDNANIVFNQGNNTNESSLSDIRSNKGKYYDPNDSEWHDFTISVSLDNQDATTAGAASVTATYGSAMPSISENKPAKDGYTFGGYYDEVAGGGTKYIHGTGNSAHAWDKTIASPELYALWTQTVTLHKNGGKANGSVTATYNSAGPFSPSAPTKVGYKVVDGYYAEDGCTNKVMTAAGALVEYTDFVEDGKWVHDGATTLYAKWTAKSCTVTFDKNGGSTGSDDATATYDSALPDITPPTRSGYTFDGYWSSETDNDGTGTQYYDAEGHSVINWNVDTESETTLYAKWLPIYTVSWSVNGDTWSSGVVAGNTNVTSGLKVSTLPTAPTKVDCDDLKKFVGWTTEEDYSDDEAPEDLFTDVAGSPTITANTTFYAVFANQVGPNVNTVLWSEDWTGESANAMPGHPTESGSTVYGVTKASIDYKYSDGTGTNASGATKVYNESTGGGTAPELMVHGNETTPGYFKIEGIPSGGADSLTLSFKRNNYTLTPSVSGDGYILSSKISGTGKDTYVYYIKCGSGAPFDLTFTGPQSKTNNVRLDDIELKVKTNTASGFVTTCAECTAAPELETPVVTSETCEGTTVTASVSSFGTGDGCHIRNYGFVWSTSENPTIASYTGGGKQNWNANIEEGEEFSLDIDELSIGTRYHVRAYAENKYGVAYSEDVVFDTEGINRIAVTTAPTRTKYLRGEKFDPTGLVVTAYWPDGTTADVTEDCIFSPSLSTALATSDESITVTYRDETCSNDLNTNQTIGVYTLTVTETAAMAGCSFTKLADSISIKMKFGAAKTCDFDVSGATLINNGDFTYSFTNPTGNVTATITYRAAEKVAIHYYINGSELESLKQEPYESTTATLKTGSEVSTAMSAAGVPALSEAYANFVGWTTTPFFAQTYAPLFVYDSYYVDSDVNLYAVFSNVQRIRLDEINLSLAGNKYLTEEQTLNINDVDIKYHYLKKNSDTQVQFKQDASNPGYLYNNDALSNIRGVEIGATGTNDNVPVYAGSEANDVSEGALIDANTHPYKYSYIFPENKSFFTVKGDNSNIYYIDYIDVFYGATGTVRYVCQTRDTKARGSWKNTATWANSTIPGVDDVVRLKHDVSIYENNKHVADIVIDTCGSNSGHLDIFEDGGLIVEEGIHVWNGSAFGPTTRRDLEILTDNSHNGGLICGAASDNTVAEYGSYMRSYKAGGFFINQYIGVPFTQMEAYQYYGFNIFQYDPTRDDWKTPDGSTLQAWTAYNFIRQYSGDDWHHFYVEGTLNLPGLGGTHTFNCNWRAVDTTSIDGISGHQDYLFANSWTAPISITNIEESDCDKLVHTIYIFNSGYEDGESRVIGSSPGQWSAYPFKSAHYMTDTVIPAAQAFLVTATAEGASLTLDYKKHVYDPAVTAGRINTSPTRAPKRTTGNESNDPTILKMVVRADSTLSDVLHLFQRGDFSNDFDNGWDGHKIFGENFAPQLYAMQGESKMAVGAVPELDETEIGFKAGTQANEYTFSFEYDEQEEPLYLYDKDTQEFTEITNENTYSFTTSDRKEHARFILTRSNVPQSPTGVEEVENETVQRAEKFMKDQQIFIRRGERTYSITGARVR